MELFIVTTSKDRKEDRTAYRDILKKEEEEEEEEDTTIVVIIGTSS